MAEFSLFEFYSLTLYTGWSGAHSWQASCLGTPAFHVLWGYRHAALFLNALPDLLKGGRGEEGGKE